MGRPRTEGRRIAIDTVPLRSRLVDHALARLQRDGAREHVVVIDHASNTARGAARVHRTSVARTAAGRSEWGRWPSGASNAFSPNFIQALEAPRFPTRSVGFRDLARVAPDEPGGLRGHPHRAARLLLGFRRNLLR